MGTFKSYILGFVLSVLLTLAAYFVVANNLLSGTVLVLAIIGMAIIQLWIQLIFFLHVGHEGGPRWNLSVMLSTFSAILILILGSIWIMSNLNYNHTPTDINQYIQDEEGIYK